MLLGGACELGLEEIDDGQVTFVDGVIGLHEGRGLNHCQELSPGGVSAQTEALRIAIGI